MTCVPLESQRKSFIADVASKNVDFSVTAPNWPKTGRRFAPNPATGALEITSTYRHKAAESLQRVVCNMKPSFYFDLCCLDCQELTLKISKIVLRVHSQFRGYFDKLIGV